MSTAKQRLKLVRKAIEDVLSSGQSVAYDNRTITMADLSKLRDLEKEYEEEANQDENTGKVGRNTLIYVDPVA